MSKSIVIIDTPISCWDCPCIDGEYGECQLTNKSVPLYDALDCCPLKPYKEAIPIDVLKSWQKQYGNKCTYGTIMKCVEDWEKENEID